MQEEKVSFGAVIKKIRKERKMTQKMLSQNICSQSVLSRIENDEELPNVLVMQQLCQRLGVTIDQVMMYHSVEIQRLQQLFAEMDYHYFHNEFQKLEELLIQPGLLEHLYLDTDLQLYYFYLGSCDFFLHNDHASALKNLKQELSYTFQLDKFNVSTNEIQTISSIGMVYAAMGQIDLAKENLERSIDLFYHLPQERVSKAAARLFYNYAQYLYSMGDYQKALSMAQQGVATARRQNNYYYLEELFHLMGVLHEKLAFKEAAAKFFKISEAVNHLTKI